MFGASSAATLNFSALIPTVLEMNKLVNNLCLEDYSVA